MSQLTFFLVQNLFCCNLRCFVAKSVLSRFARFCVEKNWAKNCACGEKKTIIRYDYDPPVCTTFLERWDPIASHQCITLGFFNGSSIGQNKHSKSKFVNGKAWNCQLQLFSIFQAQSSIENEMNKNIKKIYFFKV